MKEPEEKEWLRVEGGIRSGDTVSHYYDPMIAKLVVHGSSREEALARLIQALREYVVVGIQTNIAFLLRLATQNEFQAGKVHTGFIPQHKDSLFPLIKPDIIPLVQAASILKFIQEETKEAGDPWNVATKGKMNFCIDGQEIPIQIYKTTSNSSEISTKSSTDSSTDSYIVTLELKGNKYVQTVHVSSYKKDGLAVRLTLLTDKKYTWTALHQENTILLIDSNGNSFTLFQEEILSAGDSISSSPTVGNIVAPMFASVSSLLVKEGQVVNQGDTLIILEAMKMEHAIKAPCSGKVKLARLIQQGELIHQNTLLFTIE